jgi:hypothetical protein
MDYREEDIMRRFLFVCALLTSFPLAARADMLQINTWALFSAQTCVTCTQMIGASFLFDTSQLKPGDSFAYAVPGSLRVCGAGYLGSNWVGGELIHWDKDYMPFVVPGPNWIEFDLPHQRAAS